MTFKSVIGSVLLCGIASGWTAAAANAAATNPDVGQVQFPVTASAPAQQEFNRAVAMLHSFWYEEVDHAFTQVAEYDPSCGMAYWGKAMSYYHPLWSPPDQAALQRGWEAVRKAKEIGGTSLREQDYIAAIDVFYRDWNTVDHMARSLAYSKAMEQLHQRYPEDQEAAIFYALSLIATASPADKNYSNQKKAAEILERVKVTMPDHPGVIHYLIHAYDSPPLAHLALSAARRYAQLAPAVPHAQHMPSHIFVRLGLWDEAISSNEASAAAAKEYANKVRMKGVWDEQIHAMDYLIYAALQSGRDDKARSVRDELVAIRAVNSQNPKVAYPVAAIPARFALERRRWAEAAQLTEPDWLNLDRYPWARAMISFARGVGLAMNGSLTDAKEQLGKIEAIHDALTKSGQKEWVLSTEILKRELGAWIAAAEGRHSDAVPMMAGAADLEDSTEKHPVTPGPILPAREQLAELLLRSKQPEQALREFEKSLRSAPNRLNGLYGAAKAAQASGNASKAREYFAKLIDVCSGAQGDRAELREAKAFLAGEVIPN